MKYYIYFDKYRRPKKAVSEKELVEKYSNDPERLLLAMGERYGTNGITDASTTRSPWTPRTLSSASTTLFQRDSPPIEQVPTGW